MVEIGQEDRGCVLGHDELHLQQIFDRSGWGRELLGSGRGGETEWIYRERLHSERKRLTRPLD